MADTDATGFRSDPRVIRRLNVIIALLTVPYVLFVLDRFGDTLVAIGVAAALVFGVASVWYVFAPSRS